MNKFWGTSLFFYLFISLVSSTNTRFFSHNTQKDIIQKISQTAASNCGNIYCQTNQGLCPEFPSVNGACSESGICEYTSDYNQNLCENLEECNYGNCTCKTTSLSDGCKCANDIDCDSGVCFENTCKPAYGYIGNFCQEPADCLYGTCTKDNTCQYIPAGQECMANSDCEDAYTCSNGICKLKSLCSSTNLHGYCSNRELCMKGVCQPLFNKTKDMECSSNIECAAGYNCSNYTCQRVPLGSHCNSASDCEYLTQGCWCAEPDNSVPKQCQDSGYYQCLEQSQNYITCSFLHNCDMYDILDNTTDCAKNCYKDYVAFQCCNLCKYPEYSDNVQTNIVGSCATMNIAPADCCSAGTPCVVTPTAELCAGYIN